MVCKATVLVSKLHARKNPATRSDDLLAPDLTPAVDVSQHGNGVCKFVTFTEILCVKSETFLNGSDAGPAAQHRSGDLAELPMIEERPARFLACRLRILYTRKII
jgi:hypothetical protein